MNKIKLRLVSIIFLISSAISYVLCSSIVRINEVAPYQTLAAGGDWIELYIPSTNVNLSGWKLEAVCGTAWKSFTLPAITTGVFTGAEYVVIHLATATLAALGNPVTESVATGDVNGNGYWDVWFGSDTVGTTAGLVSTDNVIVLKDASGLVIDGMVYSDKNGDWVGGYNRSENFELLVSTGQWSGPRDADVSDVKTEDSAAICTFGANNRVFHRDTYSTDTNATGFSKNDWGLTNTPTKGKQNANHSNLYPPDGITDLQVIGKTSLSITLQWTAPYSADGSTATSYSVRYSSIDVLTTTTGYFEATNYPNTIGAVLPGNLTGLTVSGLLPATTYWFIVVAIDRGDISQGNFKLGNLPTNLPISGLTDPDLEPPAAITDLSVTFLNSVVGSVKLTWTAPSDPPLNTNVTKYWLRFATFSVTALGGDTTAWWNISTDIVGEPTPAAPGTTQVMSISGLPSGVTCYFYIKSQDAINFSPVNTNSEQFVWIPPHLLISEVQFQSGHSDYIELYNPTDNSINLVDLGLKVHRRTAGGTDYLFNIEFINPTIPAKGFFLIVSTPTYQPNGKLPDARLPHGVSTTSNNISSNNSVYISLSDTALVDIIDVIAFGSGTDPFIDFGDPNAPARHPYDDSATQSVERKPGGGAGSTLGNAFDSNKYLYDFDIIAIDPQNTFSPKEPPPAIPNAPTISYDSVDISTGYIKWVLTDNADNEDGLYISSATNTGARVSPNLGPLAGTGSTTSWIEINLSSNTFYTRYGEAYKTTGSSWSASLTVCTLAYPPTVVSLTPTKDLKMDISWNYSGATKYLIAHSTANFTVPWSTSAVILSPGTTHQDTGLLGNTTYYYRIYVYNQSDVLNTNFFSPTVSTITYPAQPTGFGMSTCTTTTITWNWTAPIGGCTGYRIYRATSPTTVVAELSSVATTFEETGLSTNTAYGRFVRAYNITGESLDSNHATFYTLAATPTGLEVVSVFQSSVTLQWQANTNPPWTRYGISISTDNFTTIISTKVKFTDNLTLLTTTVYGLAGDTTYFFRTWAWNENEVMSGFSNTVSTKTPPGAPAKPENFYGVALSTVSIKWQWNISPGATYYRIYDEAGNPLADTTETSWTEFNLSSNTQCSRYVKAGNEYGLSEPSFASRYTLAYPPETLSSVPISSATINLSWNYSGAFKYEIRRSTLSIFSPYIVVSTITSPITYFSDTNLTAGLTYYYRIYAINHDTITTTEIYSPTASTRTFPSPVSIFSGVAISTTSINWQWSTAIGADGYRIYRATDNSVVAECSALTTYYIEVGLGVNLAYGRYVRAFNTSGLGELSPRATVYTLANPPTGLTVTGVTHNSVSLAWSANNNPPGTRYEVSQSTDNFALNFSTPIKLTDNHTTTTADITGLLPNTTYWFRVEAFNGDLISTIFSDKVSTTTTSPPTPVVLKICGFEDTGDTLGYITQGFVNDGNDKFFPTTSNPRSGAKSFEVLDVDEGAYIIFDTVTVSGYADVKINVWIDTNWGGFESDDEVRLYHSINGADWVQWLHKYDDTGIDSLPQDWTLYTYNVGTAHTIQLKIFAKNSANTEIFYFDDISITGEKDETPPVAISNLTALTHPSIEGAIILNWTSPGDDGTIGTLNNACYRIKWSTNVFYSFTKDESYDLEISTTATQPNTDVTYTITGLFPGTTYYFGIITRDDSGNWSTWKKDAKTNTQNFTWAQNLPPSNPTGLSGYRIEDGKKAKLTWNKNPEVDISEYKIYRKTVDTPYQHIASTPTTTYIDTGLDLQTTYFYVITAIDLSGKESGFSVELSIPPDLLAPIIFHTPLTQRNLGRVPVYIEVFVRDDLTTVGDGKGRVMSVTGKVRILDKPNTEHTLNFLPSPDGSPTYTGKAEAPQHLITLAGIEYYITATDGVNSSYFPAKDTWYKVTPPEDKPEQIFITPSNPEVVFGQEVKEVIIRDTKGNELWTDKSDGTKIIIWRGEDKDNKKLPLGSYIYELKTHAGKKKYGVVIIVK